MEEGSLPSSRVRARSSRDLMSKRKLAVLPSTSRDVPPPTILLRAGVVFLAVFCLASAFERQRVSAKH